MKIKPLLCREFHPNAHGTGAMTVDYYDKAFGFTGREGLALMGVHGVASYFTMFSRNDYDWIRQEILTS